MDIKRCAARVCKSQDLQTLTEYDWVSDQAYNPAESSLFKDSPLAREIFNKSLQTSKEEAAVSPPSSPFPNQIAMGLKLVNGKKVQCFLHN